MKQIKKYFRRRIFFLRRISMGEPNFSTEVTTVFFQRFDFCFLKLLSKIQVAFLRGKHLWNDFSLSAFEKDNKCSRIFARLHFDFVLFKGTFSAAYFEYAGNFRTVIGAFGAVHFEPPPPSYTQIWAVHPEAISCLLLARRFSRFKCCST